ncbi:hypothetical protein [Ornithinimicrobium sediminis]|uniref:hypothetical protein n=1 Tax=Ornithinimicrobium sediminis TaxID=2904603 RepID=UPI001E57BAAD|nr:hypothetical protein [Ornithinimicrobium sediminis]
MPSRPREFRSELPAPAEHVWATVTTLAGVNAELRPLLRMTHPPGWDRLDPERIPLGQPLFRSRLLLLGVLPIDYDDITIVEFGPGHRFRERSRMLSAKVWEHERQVRPMSTDSCQVIDRVAYVPRWGPLGVALDFVVPRIFGHRHRQLRRMFGSRSAARGMAAPASVPYR